METLSLILWSGKRISIQNETNVIPRNLVKNLTYKPYSKNCLTEMSSERKLSMLQFKNVANMYKYLYILKDV